jgi:hypothetical protein
MNTGGIITTAVIGADSCRYRQGMKSRWELLWLLSVERRRHGRRLR